MNSSRLLTGSWLETVSSIGPLATIAIGVKPAMGSKGRFAWIAALVVNDDDRRQRVYPSGGALDTSAAPIDPPAPGLLSTMTGCFQTSDNRLPTSRAKMSFEPPAG